MSSNGSVKILDVKIDKVCFDDAYQKFISFMMDDELKMIFTPNSEIIMKAQEDKEFKDILNKGDLVIPDGVGLLIASKINHLDLPERIPGIDLMGKMLEYCNRSDKSIYILGGKPEIAEKAGEKIKEKYPNIIITGTQDGYYNEKDELKILDCINEAKPDILFVALGAPKQEKWIYKYRKVLNVKVAMGVGGAVDVWSGNSKRAPKIYQKLGLEWLYRFIRYPSRIGRIWAIPKFLFKVITNSSNDRE